MACFSPKTKARCATFLLIVGVLFVLLGVIVASYGYLKVSGNADIIPEDSDYIKIDVGAAGTILIVAAGVLSILTGVLAILTSKCRNSKMSVFFSCPYMVLASITAILLLVIAGITSGEATSVIKNDACNYDLGGGVTVKSKIA
jgi:hypothetical protein